MHLLVSALRECQLTLFRSKRLPDPQPDLKSALEPLLGRLDQLDRTFQAMRLEWEIVTAHVDQQTNRVHRELGHVTKRKADLAKSEEPCLDQTSSHPSRFRGGRGR